MKEDSKRTRRYHRKRSKFLILGAAELRAAKFAFVCVCVLIKEYSRLQTTERKSHIAIGSIVIEHEQKKARK